MRRRDLIARARGFSAAALVAAATGAALGDSYYVTPGGSGARTGASWADALDKVQSAVDLAVNAGDVVCLRYGTYTNGGEIVIANRPGLTIRGGYAATTPLPGDFTNAPTIVTRDTSVNMRIFNVNASAVTFDGLTISGGEYHDAAASTSEKGGGLLFTNGCTVILTNCTVNANRIPANSAYHAGSFGAGLYISDGTLLAVDTRFYTNTMSYISWQPWLYGGGVACVNATSAFDRCTFTGNGLYQQHYDAFGGALYLSGGSAAISNCTFDGNWLDAMAGADDRLYGAAIYAAGGVSPFVVDACRFTGNRVMGVTRPQTTRRGAVMHLTGAGSEARVVNCELEANGLAGTTEDIWTDASRDLAISNCVLHAGASGSVYKEGAGGLTVIQCLVWANGGHAVRTAGGTAALLSSTVADNNGWGLTNSAAAVTVRDSIAWGNAGGGIATNGVAATYTCSQNALEGSGNLTNDPRLVFGGYLSDTNLPFQPDLSPCIDAGSATASALGLDTRTTRTDGSNDSAIVDLGYHYAGAVSSISNVHLYVDSAAGNDTNSGWSSGTALRTLTNALARVLPGGSLDIAAGVYTNGPGLESFPLVINTANLTIRGAGPDATVIDARQSGRVLRAAGQGTLYLEGLTFAGGYITGANGGGLHLIGCRTVITNCAFIRNRLEKLNGDTTPRYGGAIYNSAGSLAIYDCAFMTNDIYWNGGAYTERALGGAIYSGNGASVAIRRSRFIGNVVSVKHYDCFGGALCLSGGDAEISDCTFSNNYAYTSTAANYPYGGALHIDSVNPMTLDSCLLQGNYGVPGSLGGAMYLTGIHKTRVLSSVFYRNGPSGGLKGDVYQASGTLTMTNVLVAQCGTNDGLTVAGGTATVVNCTFADNGERGMSCVAGTATARNCIAWGNRVGGFLNCSVSYSDSQEAQPGVGNLAVAPVFANTDYYHLLSRAGYYDGGFFSGGAWTQAIVTSPLIDAGDPSSAADREPNPNGRRANMGVYANTATASRTFLEEPGAFTQLTVHAYTAAITSSNSASLPCEVLDAGGMEDPQTYVCWGVSDPGATTQGWDHVVDSGAHAPWELFLTDATNLLMTTYWFRCLVTNSSGYDWSEPVAFTAAQKPTVANPGASLIRRTSARLNGQIVATGGQTPSTWFYWWPASGSPTSTVAMGQQAGAFSTDLLGLPLSAAYQYGVLASNDAGPAWSTIEAFATLGTNALARYVTPEGAGAFSGLDWDNAYARVPDALADCAYPGDTIYLKHGSYSNDVELAISNMPGLRIVGSFTGSGMATSGLPSTLVAAPPEYHYARVMSVSVSTVTLERVTLRNGSVNNEDGGGLYLDRCDATLTNCTLANNRLLDSASVRIDRGAGLYAADGTLRLYACQFQTNGVYWSGYSENAHGGGASCVDTALIADNCLFIGNYVTTKHYDMYGGALALESGSADVRNCRFVANYVNPLTGGGSAYPSGGAIYAADVNPLRVDLCTFTGNYGLIWKGGSVYLQGAGLRAHLTRCAFFLNGNGMPLYPGDVYVASGTVGLTNCLVARSTGHGMYIAGGAASIVNCTFADNTGWGLDGGAGAVTVLNSIAWGNTNGGITNCAAVTYSDSQTPVGGAGNVTVDPVFADTVYYHLSSRTGCYTNGYLAGGSWTRTAATSPLIDAGDPASDYRLEPAPNGVRVNMGYDGNTPAASLKGGAGTILLFR